MDTLLLVRHALAGSNRDGLASCLAPGEGLTAEGVEQARSLGELLADDEIELGVATDLSRTGETLDLALGGRNAERIVVPELNEIHFGRYEAGPLSEYRAWAAAHPPDEPAPGGGESRAEAAARYARGLRHLLGRPERTILFVGHALVVRYVLDAAAGLVPAPVMEPVAHAAPFRLGEQDVRAATDLLERWSRTPRFRSR